MISLSEKSGLKYRHLLSAIKETRSEKWIYDVRVRSVSASVGGSTPLDIDLVIRGEAEMVTGSRAGHRRIDKLIRVARLTITHEDDERACQGLPSISRKIRWLVLKDCNCACTMEQIRH